MQLLDLLALRTRSENIQSQLYQFQMSIDKLLAQGLITTEQSFHSSTIRPRQSGRPTPRNATQKLLAQGLLIEEQLSPSPPTSKSRHHHRLSSTSTLVPDDMERPSTSSPSKWYSSRRYAPSLVGSDIETVFRLHGCVSQTFLLLQT